MSIHTAEVAWHRHDAKFIDNRYSRLHKWTFDGGTVVPGSSSPHVVKVPLSDPSAVDPEEAYVASLSSCHMLWFLSLAARDGYVVDSYVDAAEGRMADGWISVVTLKPVVAFSGEKAPTDAELDRLHHEAHAECFLARSVKSEIRVEGSWRF
jgi:organic hydroperoxide reductase OsmC/OhrA